MTDVATSEGQILQILKRIERRLDAVEESTRYVAEQFRSIQEQNETLARLQESAGLPGPPG